MIARLQSNRVRRTYLGGRRIDAFTASSVPDDGWLRPEDWLASTTTAFNGQFEIDGEGLGRLENGRQVKDVVGELPILVKLLDSDERLVIQAHPTVPFAKQFLASPVGKTECWYFLPGTAQEACVYLGFKSGITREKWMSAFNEANLAHHRSSITPNHSNPLLDCLHRIPVKSGDFVFVDGGIPHAIGAGCFMIELQEPSDLMVVAERFTPSGREIPERKMHCGLGWEKMFDVYEYKGFEFDEILARYVRRDDGVGSSGGCGVERILGPDLTEKFSMWVMRGESTLSLTRSGAVVVVTAGNGTVNGLAVARGDRLVARDESSLVLAGKVDAVVCA